MARGDLIDVGYGNLPSPRQVCKSGFMWKYANTSQEAINTNSDIIEVFPYILRTATNYYPYSNNWNSSYVQITINGTTTTQYFKCKYNFGNVNTNTIYGLTSAYDSSNPFGYGTPDSSTYITTTSYNSKTIYGARFPVPHNADGTAPTVSVKWHFQGKSADGNIEKTVSLSLDTIPRASQPTCAGTTLGVGTRINTNRVSNSFTHTLNIKIGSTTIETFTGIRDYKDWTPSIANYLSYIPSASGTATIECITYNNGSEIGRATTSCVLTVPNNSDTKPTASVSISEGTSGVIPSGWNVYVKGKSKLAISIVGSPKAGTSIASYYSTANGSSDTRSSYTTSELTGSGTVTANVTDGRSFTSNNATASYTVEDYTNPQIYSETTIARCDSNGNITDDGTYVKWSFQGSISSVSNKNAKTFTLKYAEKGTNNWTTIYTYNSDYTLPNDATTIDVVDGSGNIDITKEYVFRFEATDSFTTTAKEVEIGTVADLINYNASGKSMAIGGVSQRGSNENVLDVYMESDFHKDLYYNGFDMINDTTGADWQTMMKNKIDYCVANMNTNKTNTSMFINGGWYGVKYGFGIFSKIGSVYQLVWFSVDGFYYYVLKSGNEYQYKVGNDIIVSQALRDGNGNNIIASYPRAGNLGATSFDDVGVGGKLQRSGLYGEQISGGDWYYIINVRHRNGESDGYNFGLQIVSSFWNTKPKLTIRNQSGNSWSGWRDISCDDEKGTAFMKLTSRYTASLTVWVKTTIEFNGRNDFFTSNSNFSYVTNGIKCNFDGWVFITGCICNNYSGEFDCALYRNNDEIVCPINVGGCQSFASASYPVSNGDIIYLKGNSGTTNPIIYEGTHITIERVS